MDSQASRARFQTTRWSVVLRTRSDGPEAHRALEEVCRSYWMPLYTYARRWGSPPADAEDLVQNFFISALRRQLFSVADPDAGRLRNLLLTAFKRHMQDAAAHQAAWRRKPADEQIALDYLEAEKRSRADAQNAGTAEALYERHWALSVLELAMTALRSRYQQEQKHALFEALESKITGTADNDSTEAIAAALSMTPSALGVALHRMRKRYRECLRDTIRQTVSSDEEIDAELCELGRILSAGGT